MNKILAIGSVLVMMFWSCNSHSSPNKNKQSKHQQPLGHQALLGYRLGMDVEELRVLTLDLFQKGIVVKRYAHSTQNLPAIDYYLPNSDSLKVTSYFHLEDQKTVRTIDSRLVLAFASPQEQIDRYHQLSDYLVALHGPAHTVVDKGKDYKRMTWDGECCVLVLLLDSHVGVTFRYVTKRNQAD